MISSVFVDRPRLAVVIAVLITIAGALAMLRIPVAQFPAVVPPEVEVSTRYPGASAAVVMEEKEASKRGLHPLGPAELLLDPLALGDVAEASRWARTLTSTRSM